MLKGLLSICHCVIRGPSRVHIRAFFTTELVPSFDCVIFEALKEGNILDILLDPSAKAEKTGSNNCMAILFRIQPSTKSQQFDEIPKYHSKAGIGKFTQLN